MIHRGKKEYQDHYTKKLARRKLHTMIHRSRLVKGMQWHAKVHRKDQTKILFECDQESTNDKTEEYKVEQNTGSKGGNNTMSMQKKEN